MTDVRDPITPAEAEETGYTAERLAALAERAGMILPESVLGALVAAILTGKHLVLVGPPGTGKTTLAGLAAELGQETMMCSGYITATATSSWTVADTVGERTTGEDGETYRPGVFVEAIEAGRWLIIDELNRTDLDRAVGQFFSVLSGQSVVLPFRRTSFAQPLSVVPFGGETPPATEPIRIPKQWRVIATMNETDKGRLFRFSYALMRRFMFVRVTSPDDAAFRRLVTGPIAALLPLRDIRDLGPAIYLDAGRYMQRRLLSGERTSLALFEAFYGYFLPQLDDLTSGAAHQLLSILYDIFDPPEQLAARRLLGLTQTGRQSDGPRVRSFGDLTAEP